MKIVRVNPHVQVLPRRGDAPPMPKAKPVEPSGTYTLAKRGRSVKKAPAP